jgi:predicted transcriptional regulator
MSSSSTLTIRLKSEVKDQLEQLSVSTNRTRSFLAAEAISAYVDRELQIIGGIERGIADMKAGNVVPHDIAMDELDAAIEEAARQDT